MKRKPEKHTRKKVSAKASSPSHAQEAVGLIILVIGLFLGLSLASYYSPDWPSGSGQDSLHNWGGPAGALLAFGLIHATFGRIFTWIIPIWVVLLGIRIMKPPWKVVGILGTFRLATLGAIASGVLAYFASIGWVATPAGATLENAGWVGVSLEDQLAGFLGTTGAGFSFALAVILWMTWVVKFRPSVLVSGAALVVSKGIWLPAKWVGDKLSARFSRSQEYTEEAEFIEEDSEVDEAVTKSLRPPRPTRQIVLSKSRGLIEQPPTAITTATGVYELPPLELLNPPLEDGPGIDDKLLSENAALLEETLTDFGVNARVVEIHPGPVITRYDLEPAPGVKVSRIASLADDLTLALRAQAIRIIAPIPGQGAVGVEVPNPGRATVSLRSLLETPEFQSEASPLLFAAGKTTDGGIRLEDLRRMPHLLVAGTTGSGKSVFLNSLIVSILFRATPDEVQFILIDPKKLELSGYSELRNHHLATRPDLGEDVVTTAEGAVEILKSVELEMARRYDLLAEAGSRSIEEYNERGRGVHLNAPVNQDEEAPKPQVIQPHLPYLVVVIDELADLMLLAAKEVEAPIAHLAQMSRAVGIHLVVATQRPSVDVITGVIKANFPCRIAFQVASKIDSRTIIDMNGAETLLGKGDLLYVPPGQSIPTRLHAALISQPEIDRVIAHIRQQPMSATRVRLPMPESEEKEVELTVLPDVDPLFDEAARIVVRTQQGSVSILQRRLKVGYARAARLIDQLERAGIVGPFDGSKAREVLVEEGYFETHDRLDS
jgi:S-DNA-T family DNA segregation ATPase FtsK/SpoIIIE